MRKTTDPKFQPPHFAEYINAANKLDAFASRKLWQACNSPSRSLATRSTRCWHYVVRRAPSAAARGRQGGIGWSLKKSDFAAINAILSESRSESSGPEFMAPPARALVPCSVSSEMS